MVNKFDMKNALKQIKKIVVCEIFLISENEKKLYDIHVVGGKEKKKKKSFHIMIYFPIFLMIYFFKKIMNV